MKSGHESPWRGSGWQTATEKKTSLAAFWLETRYPHSQPGHCGILDRKGIASGGYPKPATYTGNTSTRSHVGVVPKEQRSASLQQEGGFERELQGTRLDGRSRCQEPVEINLMYGS